MKVLFRPRDTIAWRFGATIVASMAVAGGLIGLFFAFGGVWARPPMDATARLEGAMAIINMIEASPSSTRQTMSGVAATKTYRVDWYAADSSVSKWLDTIDSARNSATQSPDLKDFGEQLQRTVLVITPDDPLAASSGFPLRTDPHLKAYFFAAKLQDTSWVVFTGFGRDWGLSQVQRLGIWIAFLILSFVIVSTIAARQLSRPIRRFAKAVRRSALPPRSPVIVEEGPRELRDLIAAFNDMQTQIRDFVAYRTAMLAAISHDLRTPLTRIRLRGEFIEDTVQQKRLFRDVDEMQAMIEGALAFFRGDSDEEAMRTFDLPGILQSIADDYADQDIEVSYSGPDHMAYVGRPLALKRAFTNLIENAVKYATPPQIELSCQGKAIIVTIRDRGPGIPPDALETVFRPFYRLDKSRNRATGGFGLGLTAAQNIVLGHGGDIALSNRLEGGLEAKVTLPRVA